MNIISRYNSARSIVSGVALTASIALVGPAAAQDNDCRPTSPQNISTYCVDKPEIVVIQGTSAHSFYVSLGIGARAAGEDFGVDVDVQGALEWGPPAQTPIINAVIERKPDALIMVPTDPRALEERLVAVAEAGIVVFTADNDTNDHSLRLTQVASNNQLAGQIGAEALAHAIGGEGKILVLSTDPTNLTPSQRLAGFKVGIAKYPNIEMLETQYCGFDTTQCAADTAAVLGVNPDLKGIFGLGEPLGKGAATAVRNAAMRDQVTVGSFDASPAQVRDLNDDVVDFLIVQKPYQIGYEAVRIAAEYVRGEKVSSSPLFEQETMLSSLPEFVKTTFVIAVNDEAGCPPLDVVPCGLATDEAVQPFLYVE